MIPSSYRQNLDKSKQKNLFIITFQKPPTLKEDLAPLVAQLLALKVSFKEVTGEDFGGKPVEKPKKEAAQPEQERKNEGPSKTELNKLKRKETKAAAKAEQSVAGGGAAASSSSSASSSAVAGTDEGDEALSYLFGDAPIIQSLTQTDRVFLKIEDLGEDRVSQNIWIRARVANSRAVGKGIFLVLRQNLNTCQAICWQGSKVPKAMVKYCASISTESIVDILAEVTVPKDPIQSVTQKNVELQIKELHVVSRSAELPFSIDDAGRGEEDAAATGLPTVLQDRLLDFRCVDLRTPANQAIFRIQSGVCQLFREFLNDKGFIEIHSPKLIGGASEGGANVFTLKYFDQPACLAQSPQFYKQMAAACGGLEKVYEIGPVFRAENSNTHRHLCEFTGLDFEMCITEHYYEALEVMGDLFTFIFDGISDRFKHELKIISQQYPFEPMQYLRPSLRLTFQEGIAMPFFKFL